MKNSRSFSKTPVILSGSVHQRLTAYALAVSAAGMGIASASVAEAKIIYTPTNQTLTNGTLPLPVAGTTAFNLTDNFYIITGSWSSRFLNFNASANAAMVGAKGSASALRAGKIIGPKDPFQATKGLMAGAFCETQISASSVFGPFANTTQRYLGLKFKLHGKLHYGWARFKDVTATACRGGDTVSATLTGYAYETIPNKPIIAGKTKGPDDTSIEAPNASLTVPESRPATLGVLALGSPALTIWRREELAGARQ